MNFDLPAVEYHAAPALSASGAWQLANDCPATYFYSSPFNPDAARPNPTKIMSVGTGVHLAVLEPAQLEKRTLIIHARDYKTAAARVARDDAIRSGLTPVLEEEFEDIRTMRAAILANDLAADLLDGARTEVSYFWTFEGIPHKARADIVDRAGRIADIKASAEASPDFFMRRAWDDGHFLRDPFYRDGWLAATGTLAPQYVFIVVARTPPHIVTTFQLEERAVAWGRMMHGRARAMFRQCRKAGIWPGYSNEPMTIGLPAWAEYRMADREQAGAFDVAQIERALGFLAP